MGSRRGAGKEACQGLSSEVDSCWGGCWVVVMSEVAAVEVGWESMVV